MAIYFIQEGGYHMNTQLYTSPKDDSAIMVGIEHRIKDGYRLSYSREVIKEQLPLRGFVERETISNQQREILQQSENMKKQYPMTPDEAFRVDDKEVYYLLT